MKAILVVSSCLFVLALGCSSSNKIFERAKIDDKFWIDIQYHKIGRIIEIKKDSSNYIVKYIYKKENMVLTIDTSFNVDKNQIIKYQKLVENIAYDKLLPNSEINDNSFHNETYILLEKNSKIIHKSIIKGGFYDVNKYFIQNDLPIFK